VALQDIGVAVPREDAEHLAVDARAALAAFCHDERNPLVVHGLPSLERHIGPISSLSAQFGRSTGATRNL
jgi:hypothetical protein